MSGRLINVQVFSGSYTPPPDTQRVVADVMVHGGAGEAGGSGKYSTGIVHLVASGGCGGGPAGPSAFGPLVTVGKGGAGPTAKP